MKLHRLIGILVTIGQRGRVTMPYLAEKFEVSRRTVSRDIETLCCAGIPIVTEQGQGGGVSYADGYSLDTAALNEEELGVILSGISSLDSVTGPDDRRTAEICGKLGLSKTRIGEENLSIDLAAWHYGSLTEQIALLRSAIRDHRVVTFHYFYEKGEDDKTVWPHRIVYRWSAWYVFGWCPARSDFQLYKLDRMTKLAAAEETFVPLEIPPERLVFGQNMTDHIRIRAVFAHECAYRLVEEYGDCCYTERPDGALEAEIGFSSFEKALGWFLSFGARVKITEPDDFRAFYLAELEKIRNLYGT